MTELRDRVQDVLARDACSGCGLCAQLDRGLQMRLDAGGYARPVEIGAPDETPDAARVFARSCPGVRISAQDPAGSRRHPLLGSYFAAWEAWATDPEIRLAGSSGGVLTALHAWLVSSGRAARIAGAAVDPSEPRRSIPVTITTREQALAAAGSRYAPVAALTNPDAFAAGSAVTAKPCEIAALRASGLEPGGEAPLLLSFFCAGTPSQGATDALLEGLGIGPDRTVDAMRYRGNGWPGRFAARAGDTEVSADYEESWGSTLGPTTQWRCKVCPDGVGESADIVAADSWATDERGYPQFAEGAGVSALIARTPRGLEVIEAAIAEGVIEVRPLSMDGLASAQPLQTARRRYLLARLWGSTLAGRTPPRYRGFGLARLGLVHPRRFVQVLRGTARRVRAARGRRR
ncbi:Coenzyme F420 hydrogenase/dehydrogenase, beta subunit C-terminal domain [Microbacterium sp. SSM24]|uniref:Coenzyme F420 hydrogenase/dehydrogenase, beta subunit C-terminal domain n=1 Tax=Microbacterium sp. SSM24 TaxID=2991714 RepID=UPI002226B92A|nr:Coenzyme F420 hydrogenase/dehydrogenase, beta subunit C-terminal domain [Microbacterium sp. SSM24]MCW3492772.1 Coenzyme F420 hydrogenase/dehydrogenase, beta subunit C-terminal domain [Microbacterium sp. SSM24]